MEIEEGDAKDNGIDSRLLEIRTVLVTGAVDEEFVEKVSIRLLVLDAAFHDPIRVTITSPGGRVVCAFAIHRLMKNIASPVSCIGARWVGCVRCNRTLVRDQDESEAWRTT